VTKPDIHKTLIVYTWQLN